MIVKDKDAPTSLVIFLDTNSIMSKELRLFNYKSRGLIRKSARFKHLKVEWRIPHSAVLERQYQIYTSLNAMLPKTTELLKYLGKSSTPQQQGIQKALRRAIQQELNDLSVQVAPLHTSKVNWRKILLDSAMRNPPFSEGKNEKGFRDAMAQESIRQLVQSRNYTYEREFIFITNDKLLASSTEALFGELITIHEK